MFCLCYETVVRQTLKEEKQRHTTSQDSPSCLTTNGIYYCQLERTLASLTSRTRWIVTLHRCSQPFSQSAISLRYSVTLRSIAAQDSARWRSKNSSAYQSALAPDRGRYYCFAIRPSLSIPTVYLSSALANHKITTVSLGRLNTHSTAVNCATRLQPYVHSLVLLVSSSLSLSLPFSLSFFLYSTETLAQAESVCNALRCTGTFSKHSRLNKQLDKLRLCCTGYGRKSLIPAYL